MSVVENPVFDLPQDDPTAEINSTIESTSLLPPSDATPRDVRPKQAVSKKLSGRLLIAIFAVIGLLILGAVVAIIVLRPSSSNNSSISSTELELLKMQVQKLSDENANKTQQLKTIQLKFSNNNETIYEMQQKQSEMQQRQNEIQIQQKSSNATIQTELTEIRILTKQTEETLSGRLDNVTNMLNSDIASLNMSTNTLHNDIQEIQHNIRNEIHEKIENIEHRSNISIESIREDFLSFQLHTNTTSDAIRNEIERLNWTSEIQEVQNDLESAKSNLTKIFQMKLDTLNSSLVVFLTSSERGLFCDALNPPINGSIRTEAGPNSHTNGLDSVTTYSCDSGYSLVGGATRTCRDINGGTVTTGTWSGAPPTCQEILCSQLLSPVNGVVTINSLVYSTGVVANYTCHSGYVLVGDETRTCEEQYGGGTVGTWTGQTPHCQIIVTCSSLSAPSNGAISVSSGSHGVSLGLGAIATFSCNTGYGLIGSARRTCQTVSGGSVGTWTGSQPYCQEILTCPSLPPLIHGTMVFTPGADNSNIGLGSVVTYSCNLGYVLVGGATRLCQSLYGGHSAAWTGHPPICNEAVYCLALTAPDNGSVTISSELNPLSVGSVASYSCDPGHALLGPPTRTCVDPDGDSVGTWTGNNVECSEILCPELAAPDNGTVVTSSINLSVGVTATFSCDPGLVLVGEDTRTCEEQSGGGTTGTWSGTVATTCAVPNRAMIDCQDTVCRYEQLVCPEQDNCTVDCYDSHQYACYQTDVFCPSRTGDCTVNCDDSYACLQANTTCPQGDCTVNCQNEYTCLNSVIRCSGDNCLLNCDGANSCADIVVEGTSGNYTMNCNSASTCQDSTVICPPNGECSVDCRGSSACTQLELTCPERGDCDIDCSDGLSVCQHTEFNCSIYGNCDVDCIGSYACRYTNLTCPVQGDCDVYCNSYFACGNSMFNCSADGYCNVHCQYYYSCYQSQFLCPSGGHCDFTFIASRPRYSDYTGAYSVISCEDNSSCSVQCRSTTTSNNGHYPCRYSRITCPRESGNCSVECGHQACQRATIDCGVSGDCLTCSGPISCQYATITYNNNAPASLNCNGTSSCQSLTITCPQNNCTIHCTDDNTCQYATITCPTNNSCTINCDGLYSCNNAAVTCPTGDHSCNILCTDPLSCSNLSITNTHNLNLQCCGDLSCVGAGAIPTSYACPYIQ